MDARKGQRWGAQQDPIQRRAEGTRGKEVKESQEKATRAKAAETSLRGAQASGRLCRKSCAICPARTTRADVTATDGTWRRAATWPLPVPRCGLHLCMVCGSKEHGASTCPANKKAE